MKKTCNSPQVKIYRVIKKKKNKIMQSVKIKGDLCGWNLKF